MIRRMILCFSLLAACSNDPNANDPLGNVVSAFKGQQPAFTPRFAARFNEDVPVLQVALVEQQAAINLILEREDGPFTYWITVDGAHIILKSRMLHSTRGLGEGLLASEIDDVLDLIRNMQSGNAERFHTYLDGSDRAVTRTYSCEITNEGPQDLVLTDAPIPTVLMAERCNNAEQAFVNFYWVAPATKQIMQARQWPGPFIGPLTTRIVSQ